MPSVAWLRHHRTIDTRSERNLWQTGWEHTAVVLERAQPEDKSLWRRQYCEASRSWNGGWRRGRCCSGETGRGGKSHAGPKKSAARRTPAPLFALGSRGGVAAATTRRPRRGLCGSGGGRPRRLSQ